MNEFTNPKARVTVRLIGGPHDGGEVSITLGQAQQIVKPPNGEGRELHVPSIRKTDQRLYVYKADSRIVMNEDREVLPGGILKIGGYTRTLDAHYQYRTV